jgi:hypothetical protein
LLESRWIAHGHVSENFAVEFDALRDEHAHELRIAESIDSTGGIDPRYPQSAEISLAEFSANVGVLPRLPEYVHSLTNVILSAAPKAFALSEYTLVTTTGLGASLDAGHYDKLLASKT